MFLNIKCELYKITNIWFLKSTNVAILYGSL